MKLHINFLLFTNIFQYHELQTYFLIRRCNFSWLKLHWRYWKFLFMRNRPLKTLFFLFRIQISNFSNLKWLLWKIWIKIRFVLLIFSENKKNVTKLFILIYFKCTKWYYKDLIPVCKTCLIWVNAFSNQLTCCFRKLNIFSDSKSIMRMPLGGL